MHLSIANAWNTFLYELVTLSCLNANNLNCKIQILYVWVFGLCPADRAKLVRELDVNAVAIYGKTVGERKEKNVFCFSNSYIYRSKIVLYAYM